MHIFIVEGVFCGVAEDVVAQTQLKSQVVIRDYITSFVKTKTQREYM